MMNYEPEQTRTYSGEPAEAVNEPSDDIPVSNGWDTPVMEGDAPVTRPVPPVAPTAPTYTVVSETPVYTDPLPPAPTPEPKKKRGVGVGGIIAIALCCSLIGGALGALGMGIYNNRSQKSDDPQVSVTDKGGKQEDKGQTQSQNGQSSLLEGDRIQTTIDVNKVDTSKVMTAAEVYAVNINSVVGITTSVTTNLFGYQTTSAASGSGFVLSADGYVLTNQHVIEGSSSITVTFYDGTSADATLIGYDTSNDIAVLKVEATGLTPVTMGDSDLMNVGDQVIAIGNPLGELTFSLTSGVVSALNREVTTSSGVTMNLIQTDCAINSGNSGGPLFNLYGELIGITNAKYSGSSASGASIDNIGFAIPINNVRSIVEGIIENGYFSKPYIGISVSDVSAEAQSYGLPQGAAVALVEEGSPAEKAGLQLSDIITHADGKEVDGSNTLVSIVRSKEVGSELKLTVYRQGQTLEIIITVGEQIQDSNTNDSSNSQSSSGNGGYGGYGGYGGFGGYGGY